MKRPAIILTLLTFCCAAMALVELVIQPGYALKSAIKLILFLSAAVLCRRDLSGILRPRGLGFALGLGIGIFGFLMAAYLIFQPFLDPEAIAAGLLEKEHVSRENFLWVALYISIINSFLEELLFRGVGYLALGRHLSPKAAGPISAAAFSLYHVAILRGWFSWWIYSLCLLGLFVGGLIFNALDRRGSILPSWIAHASANLAINAIGMTMLF